MILLILHINLWGKSLEILIIRITRRRSYGSLNFVNLWLNTVLTINSLLICHFSLSNISISFVTLCIMLGRVTTKFESFGCKGGLSCIFRAFIISNLNNILNNNLLAHKGVAENDYGTLEWELISEATPIELYWGSKFPCPLRDLLNFLSIYFSLLPWRCSRYLNDDISKKALIMVAYLNRSTLRYGLA